MQGQGNESFPAFQRPGASNEPDAVFPLVEQAPVETAQESAQENSGIFAQAPVSLTGGPVPVTPAAAVNRQGQQTEPPPLPHQRGKGNVGGTIAQSPAPNSASPVTPQTEMADTPRRRPRFSPFVGDENHAAGHITIDDTTYWYREMSPELKAWMLSVLDWMAEKMGITRAELESQNFERVNAKVPEIRNFVENLSQYYADIYSEILFQTLVYWDWPHKMTRENVNRLAYEHKADVARQVRRSTDAGLSFESFRKITGG